MPTHCQAGKDDCTKQTLDDLRMVTQHMYHRIIEWLGLEGTFNIILCFPWDKQTKIV